MTTKHGIHCYISGRVQGVWFRASTQEQAESRGLTGWAKNLPDGRVEVMAFGEKDKLEKLHQWLKKGPPLGKVTDLTYEEFEWKDHGGFKVL